MNSRFDPALVKKRVATVSYLIATEEIARLDGSQAATLSAGNSLGVSPFCYASGQPKRE